MIRADRSFEAGIELARTSALGRLARSVADALLAAAQDSRTARAAAALRASFTRLPVVDRVRVVACTVAVAAATHLGGRALMPARMAPAAPISATWLILSVAILVALLARPLTRAARSSRYFGNDAGAVGTG